MTIRIGRLRGTWHGHRRETERLPGARHGRPLESRRLLGAWHGHPFEPGSTSGTAISSSRSVARPAFLSEPGSLSWHGQLVEPECGTAHFPNQATGPWHGHDL